jgi:hypothetical protein
MARHDKTAAARNARFRERKRQAEGVVAVTVMVPEDRREDLKAIAAEMRSQAAVTHMETEHT